MCGIKGSYKLKLQYFGHLMRRVDSLEKTLIAERDWGQEEKGTTEDEMAGWHHWFNGHEFEQTLGDGRTGKPDVLQSMGSQRVGHDLATERTMVIHFTYIPHCISSSISMDINVASSFWLLWIVSQWTQVCKYLFKSLLSILLGIYLVVKLLDHMVILCLIFEEHNSLF